MEKLKIAIFSLTCCEGCQFAILDRLHEILKLAPYLEISQMRLLEEDGKYPASFDAIFVEGTPLTQKNIETLKNLRSKTKTLIALGACAHTAGIHGIKNYEDKEKLIQTVYPKNYKTVENLDPRPLSAYVPVEFSVPGCPVEPLEFLKTLHKVIAANHLSLSERPVCWECQINENECVLQKGEPCLGPVTQCGCDAICVNQGKLCEGCRGPIPKAPFSNLNKLADYRKTQEKFNYQKALLENENSN
jgi:coenzyme F420-reducing hydrogenase gamma subunit